MKIYYFGLLVGELAFWWYQIFKRCGDLSLIFGDTCNNNLPVVIHRFYFHSVNIMIMSYVITQTLKSVNHEIN